MQLIFNYNGTGNNPTLEEYALKKLANVLTKFSTDAIKAELTFSEVKIEKQVHLHLVSERGHVFEISTKNSSFECCIDRIQEMTRRQIVKENERYFSKKRAQIEYSYKKQGIA
ncbi:MAG: HPF/RaiA family ribosome-associated protein [Oligoflexales bacterium]